jgi:hypothetical protein
MQLIGGTYLTVSCTLNNNRYRVVTCALIDSRANSFVFINIQYTVNIARFLGLKTRCLPRSVPVKGYNSKEGQLITHYLRLHLTVDRCR